MDIAWLIDIILHVDKHLEELVQNYGTLTYAILFLVIFCETGLVVTPFLPGDSLLFAAGALSATGILEVKLTTLVILVAAIVGDTVNYHVGQYLAPQVSSGRLRLVKREHIEKTHTFFERYGGKTIIIARFVPIVRTVAPFLAGAGTMRYSQFIIYNVVGALMWVAVCVGAGFLFGNMPVVKNNFSLVVLGIIVVSLLPAVYEVVMAKRRPALEN